MVGLVTGISIPNTCTSAMERTLLAPGRIISTSVALFTPLSSKTYLSLFTFVSSGFSVLLLYRTVSSNLTISSKPKIRSEQQESLRLNTIISKMEETVRRLTFHHGFTSRSVWVTELNCQKPLVLLSMAREATPPFLVVD